MKIELKTALASKKIPLCYRRDFLILRLHDRPVRPGFHGGSRAACGFQRNNRKVGFSITTVEKVTKDGGNFPA